MRTDTLKLCKDVVVTLLQGRTDLHEKDLEKVGTFFDALIHSDRNMKSEELANTPSVAIFQEGQELKRNLMRKKHGKKIDSIPGLSYTLTAWEHAVDGVTAVGSDLFYLLDKHEEGEECQ